MAIYSTYYTPAEISKLLKVNSTTVARWLRSGELEGHKLGPRLWRITQNQLDKFINKKT